VGFEQAAIKVQNEADFDQLRAALQRCFAAPNAEAVLKRMHGKGVRVRDFDGVLKERILERADEPLAQSGKTARQLYESLSLSDQAQMREFYLFKVEEVDPALRAKFHKIYQYY